MKELSSRELAQHAARLALTKKGFDVRILKLKDISSVCDYFVIVSGEADVQVKAIGRAVEEGLREQGIKPFQSEGQDRGNWILLDYVDVVVHVFYEPTRKHYQLERLWGDAPVEELTDVSSR